MYNFIDVLETSEGMSLPSEALKINGEYIEDQIAGYRTLTVEGREALSPEVETYDIGIRDGSTMTGKRYPARIIRITYQLVALSNEEFRYAFNKLAAILDVKDAELIFEDEPDKYFTGTPCAIGEVEPGKNAVVGQFEILCLDPFKYSVEEYEAVPVEGENSILVDYNGTYKSFPKLRAEFYKENEASEDGETVQQLTGAGDCGYVAFFNEDEKIIQMGDPDEVDAVSVAPSQTLINSVFTTWGSAAQSQWPLNSGLSSGNVVETGSVAIGIAAYKTNETRAAAQHILTATSHGAPDVVYKIKAYASRPSETSAKIEFTISCALGGDKSYFLNGYILDAVFKSDGNFFKGIRLKEKTDQWRGKAEHIKKVTITFNNLTAASTYIGGVKFKVSRADNFDGTAGNLAEVNCNSIYVPPFYSHEASEYYLRCSNFGTGSQWHGASITRAIPADASGNRNAKNFKAAWKNKISISNGTNAASEIGAFHMLLVSGSGASRKILAGVLVLKGSSGKKATLRFIVNDAVKKNLTIDLSYKNKFGSMANSIVKFGNKVDFSVFGFSASFKDNAIADVAASEITCRFLKHGNKAALSYNGLYNVSFTKNNCSVWRDIPNKFGADDVVEADCSTGKIYLNGTDAPAYGALGNDWEGFYLTPGLNQIGFSYSDWVADEYAPSVKVKYREVFL